MNIEGECIVNNQIDIILIFFVVFWIGGAIGVRNDNDIKQKEVHIPVWLNMILFLKNDNRALLGMFAFQISVYVITIISILLGYCYKPFNNNPWFVFYNLMIVPGIVGGIYAIYLGIRDHQERKKNKKRRFL